MLNETKTYVKGPAKRSEMLAYIIAYKQENDGNSPTIREIMNACGMKTPSHVSAHLKTLAEQGLIGYRDGKIIIPGGQWIPPKELTHESH